MITIDLNKLPQISNLRGLLRYDPFQEFPELEKLGDISERIYGCGYFIAGWTDEKYPHYCEKAYLRAALNEFVSINEMLKKTFFNICIDKTDFLYYTFLKN